MTVRNQLLKRRLDANRHYELHLNSYDNQSKKTVEKTPDEPMCTSVTFDNPSYGYFHLVNNIENQYSCVDDNTQQSCSFTTQQNKPIYETMDNFDDYVPMNAKIISDYQN